MDRQIVKAYIEDYKRNFEKVHHEEIYKWKAIKQFQDNFDIDSADFYSNLENSLSKASNLLDSGQYFPKRMLLKNTETSPEEIREMFRILFDEDFDIIDRIENFKNDFRILNHKNFDELSDYQDHRAIIVYLTLNFPERFFFYKFHMFKDFSEKVGYTFNPIRGRKENILHYQNLCELVRYEISKDQELLALHENRLGKDCYRDKNLNVLTQDFIYAVVGHLNSIAAKPNHELPLTQTSLKHARDLRIKLDQADFTPRTINFIQNDIENKRIGDLGEIWVLKHERDYLIRHSKNNLAENIKHVSKDLGDGLGFDILSYDLDGSVKFIEVKTTKGKANSTFFVSRNELEKSKIEKDKYFLYRVFEFNENTQQGKILEIQGELTTLCEIPLNYKVTLKK
jgi:hypothetical protein